MFSNLHHPMSHPLRQALRITGLAITLGVLGDFLLRPFPWGSGFLLWTAALTTLTLGALRPWKATSAIAAWMWLPILFAGCMVWRDSPFLRIWDLLAVLVAWGVVGFKSTGVRLGTSGVLDYLFGIGGSALSAMAGPLGLANEDMEWSEIHERLRLRGSTSVLVGLLIALPLLLVFGPLFMSADPVFEHLVRGVINWDFGTVASHLLVAGGLSWVTLGYLRGLSFASPSPYAAIIRRTRPGLGMVEIGIALGSLAAIFGLFVAIQVRYLFGGEAMVMSITGLTYAEYARRGFFELVTVAALLVPVLLGAHWALDITRAAGVRIFRALASVLLGLTAAIMISAFRRMLLYVEAYGLTADRLLATTFMLWIAVVLSWFALTVLSGRSERFALGALVSGFVMLMGLNLLNPESLIARTNLERARLGRDFDVSYATRMSADALPVLVEGIADLPVPSACSLLEGLAERHEQRRTDDWRSWNLSEARAERVLEHVPLVQRRLGCTDVDSGVSGENRGRGRPR
jgi:hypothetical protein